MFASRPRRIASVASAEQRDRDREAVLSRRGVERERGAQRAPLDVGQAAEQVGERERERLEPGPRQLGAALVSAQRHHPHAVAGRLLGEHLQERRLLDPRLAVHDQREAPSPARVSEQPAQPREFRLASEQHPGQRR